MGVSRNFDIRLRLDQWPWWLRWTSGLRRVTTDHGFKLELRQRGRQPPLTISGYVALDGTLTVSVDANGGSRLKVVSQGLSTDGRRGL